MPTEPRELAPDWPAVVPLALVCQRGSSIGETPSRRATLRSLGVRRPGHQRLHRLNGAICGMIRVVDDLVEVREVGWTLAPNAPRALPRRLALQSHDVHAVGGGCAEMSETPYVVDGKPALFLSVGSPSEADQYFLAERYDGFYSISWSSPMALVEFLYQLFDATAPILGSEESVARGVVVRDGDPQFVGGAEALRLVHSHPESVKLLRIEFGGCTVVWNAPRSPQGAAEAGIMCVQRDAGVLAALVRRTATFDVGAQAAYLVERVTSVVQPPK